MRRIDSFDSNTATAAGEWHIRCRACGWIDGWRFGCHMTMPSDHVCKSRGCGFGSAESGRRLLFLPSSRSRAATRALWVYIIQYMPTYVHEYNTYVRTQHAAERYLSMYRRVLHDADVAPRTSPSNRQLNCSTALYCRFRQLQPSEELPEEAKVRYVSPSSSSSTRAHEIQGRGWL